MKKEQKIEWYRIKTVEQIIRENPHLQHKLGINGKTIYLHDKKFLKKVWTINEKMVWMMETRRIFPFIRINQSDISRTDNYTHKLAYDHVNVMDKIHVAGSWSFHESWFYDELIDNFDLTDEDFFI